MSALLASWDKEIDFLCGVGPTTDPRPELTPTCMLSACLTCHCDLSELPAPKGGEWASDTSCPGCGRWYFVMGRPQPSSLDCHAGSGSEADREPSGSKKNSLRNFGREVLEELLGPACVKRERREWARYPMSAPVVGVPLDADGRPICEAIALTLLNISEGGLSAMARQAIPGNAIVIDFASAGCPSFQKIGRICWCETAHGITKFGCEFRDPSSLTETRTGVDSTP
ncbi:hypothetical protein K2D_06570 [Planctomycetes bacterium K2D]|uniref:PilZ domain-containing protein n=2 Tax=Botrimarina mediterranea TaxID=2528022 RepID=A0A518K3X1_9BACT|nr:hypothetical protein Spa11_06760 [Botrimarina mediterranea]QDV77070.1 hypothetical protein K2D_06570 [Planctomycetes bacterium K2D]